MDNANTVGNTVGNSEQLEFTIEPYVAPPVEWWVVAAVLGLGGLILISGIVLYYEAVKKK
jgi:hypothetical protein